MWSLGQSPIVFPALGGFYPLPTSLFSPSELSVMQTMLDQTDKADQERLFKGLDDLVTRLKTEDSVNTKLITYALNLMKGTLSEEAASLDEKFPSSAPHMVLLGPSFPRDAKDIHIAAKIGAIGMNGIVDDRGFISDPYWQTVTPAERLSGHVFHVVSGLRAGDDIAIVLHRVKGAGAPSIVLEETVDLAPGDKFTIPDILMPQDNLRKHDRSRDWIISSAIKDTFNATLTSPVIRNAYWTAKANLKGRDLHVGGNVYKILTHTIGAFGVITIDGPIPGNVAFTIPAKSPFETGKQTSGTLRAGDGGVHYGLLEPTTRIRLWSGNVQTAASGDGIVSSEEMVDRYLHMRFQKYFGSFVRLNRFRKTAKLINQQFQQQLLRRDDIIAVNEDLNLPLKVEE